MVIIIARFTCNANGGAVDRAAAGEVIHLYVRVIGIRDENIVPAIQSDAPRIMEVGIVIP